MHTVTRNTHTEANERNACNARNAETGEGGWQRQRDVTSDHLSDA